MKHLCFNLERLNDFYKLIALQGRHLWRENGCLSVRVVSAPQCHLLSSNGATTSTPPAPRPPASIPECVRQPFTLGCGIVYVSEMFIHLNNK